jgi:hypothetical protein
MQTPQGFWRGDPPLQKSLQSGVRRLRPSNLETDLTDPTSTSTEISSMPLGKNFGASESAGEAVASSEKDAAQRHQLSFLLLLIEGAIARKYVNKVAPASAGSSRPWPSKQKADASGYSAAQRHRSSPPSLSRYGNDPRRMVRWVIRPNQRSTWFNHEE